MLKNLDGDFDPEYVLDDLKNKKIENVEFITVKKFTTQKSRKEGKTLPIYTVQISQNSTINNLKQIKTVLHSLVTWEKLIKKDRIQCKRCQRIGHVAFNCNLKYRCVKCEVPHNPGECPRSIKMDTDDSEKEPSQPFCINCKQYGHPASYRGCPRLKELKQKIEARKLQMKEEQERKIKAYNNIIKPNISYSSIVANKQQEHTTTQQQTPKIQPPTNTNINPTHTPSFLEEIKKIISITISTQIAQLAENITANANKIDIIAEALDINW
ncbi:Nucleic-acid-binding protein from transposon X-element [Anthophora plagiata]